jgi:hypothetical protein
MAPPKSETQNSRVKACAVLLEIIATPRYPDDTEMPLEATSIVKGLFNRIVREDQWDWFTVSKQLGYPSRRISEVIAKEITSLRLAIKSKDATSFQNAQSNLCRLPLRRCLSIMLGTAMIADEPGAGWIYILSNREFNELLKIGMTTRTVEQRAQEINGATGVAIPFGVRRCWRVSDPRLAEKLVHEVLSEHRLRGDREFFRVSFHIAAKLLDETIRESGLEIRTLNSLAALAAKA